MLKAFRLNGMHPTPPPKSGGSLPPAAGLQRLLIRQAPYTRSTSSRCEQAA